MPSEPKQSRLARNRPQPKHSRAPKDGLSYLYLFFAPVKEFWRTTTFSEIMINAPVQVIRRKGKTVDVPNKFHRPCGRFQAAVHERGHQTSRQLF